MIVLPVPCRFDELLKLSTSTSPFWILPDVTGRDDDRVGVEIAVVGDGRGQRRVMAQVFEHALRARRRAPA